MCVEVFLVMLAGSMLSPLHVAEAGTRWFKSKAGGYQVGIPDSWHVKEIPGRESYQAALSREQVEKPGELYRYGLSILRVKDYHSFLKFEASDPAELAMRFASGLAGADGGSQQGLLISTPGSLRGMDSWRFRITKGGGTPECAAMWLVVGIKGSEWVHALWEVPCGEREAREREIESMVEGLVVLPKWGP